MSDATCDTQLELREGANSASCSAIRKTLEGHCAKYLADLVGYLFSKHTLCFVARWEGNTDPKLAIARREWRIRHTMDDLTGGGSGERATGTPNTIYDLSSVLFHALEGGASYDTYIEDAERE